MQVINAQQGSDEWLAIRRSHNTASEASAMMGASPYLSRSQLLDQKKTGVTPEVDAHTQAIFDRGHEIEHAARSIAEDIIGEELYPSVALDDDGYLLASFDGITMLEDVIWECKSWNKQKASEVPDGRCPTSDYWQVQQQLAVSGAERCLYMVTDGTEEKTVYCWVTPNAEDIERLRAAWAQFDKDLESHEPAAPQIEAV